MARFYGIDSTELCCPDYGRYGSMSKEAATLQKRVIKALFAAFPTVPYSITASRVNQVQAASVAMQKAIAYNILDYRYTKLAKPRVVGGASAAAPRLKQRLLGGLMTTIFITRVGCFAEVSADSQRTLRARCI
jgi:hypothetical protein